jgi:hypothetical protein
MEPLSSPNIAILRRKDHKSPIWRNSRRMKNLAGINISIPAIAR